MRTILKNGTVVFRDHTEKTDLLIDGERIAKIDSVILESADKVVDAEGKYIFPGFIDLHVHLREPGQERKEDILSGSKAAVKGGFTSVCCMPNTKPVNDQPMVLNHILRRAAEVNLCRVYPISAITKGSEGEQLTDIGKLSAMGAVAFSDDGKPVENPHILRNALLYAKDFPTTIVCHSEEKALSRDGVANEGFAATQSGLRAIPKVAEELGVIRDVLLAESVGAKVHIAHVSTAGAVQLIREAKARGVKVTCETAPHYLSLTDEKILGFNTDAKVNPPLRSERDVAAVVAGILDGTIDCIATDHAPHAKEDKECEFDSASFGISGLETAFSVVYTYLVRTSKIDLPCLARLMSVNPSEIFGLGFDGIREGAKADLVIADLDAKYVVDKSTFVSKGKNTPFDGMELFGKVEKTYVGGELKYNALEAQQ